MRRMLLVTMFAPLFAGVLLDRVAAVVDNRVIKDSDIEREIRVTAYLNGEKPDLSPAARRQAANRLIDQAIIRRELELGRYQEADDEETGKLLASTLKSHPALDTYGITTDQLRRALKWQLTVIHFIDMRFRPQKESNEADPFMDWLDESRRNSSIKYLEEELQ